MKVLTVLVAAQLFLLVAGSDVSGEPKKVGCYFLGTEIPPNGTLYPEAINASICSHLSLAQGTLNDNDEIAIDLADPTWKLKSEDFVSRLVKLKTVNPDLKLTLLIKHPDMGPFLEPSRRTNIIQNAVKWLNETGYNGLDFPFFNEPGLWDKMADFICEMKSEFDKYGYMVIAILADRLYSDPIPGKEDTISKLARCCEYVTLVLTASLDETNYQAPMKYIISNLDRYLKRGLPANKTKISIASHGFYVRLEDPKDNGIGAKISGPATDHPEFGMGIIISNKQLRQKLNDSSLGWTVHRDEDTKEVYAFSQNGLWTTYDDPESLAFKARYVMEKGLRGMVIAPIDMDDYEDIGGEGRFPLTRAIYNTFRQQNISLDTTP